MAGRAEGRHPTTSSGPTPSCSGTPTRFGNVASQLKQYLDTLGPQWGEGKLADKVYAGFTAAKTDHGGQESTLLALYNTDLTTSAGSLCRPATPTP